MGNNVYVDNLGMAAYGNDRLERVAPPGEVGFFQPLQDRDPSGPPGGRPKPDGAMPMVSEEVRREMCPEGTLNLRSNCPVCGKLYQPGEGVAALTCLPFATSAMPTSPAATGCEPSAKIILGHHGCVLPRLLTLIASFQPEGRFVRAFKDFSAGDLVSPEGHHDEP